MSEISEDERTNCVGLYHYGVSYRCAADALGTIKLRATHPEAPRMFLYYHAIELFLKAYLRHSGMSVLELQKLGHSTKRLKPKFLAAGGHLDDEDVEVLELMSKTNAVIRSRYIITGAFVQPTAEALARTTKSLNATVRAALKAAKQPIW